MSNRLRTAIISVIVGVWAINMLAPLAVHDFKPSPEVNIGFTFAIATLIPGYKNKDKDKDKDKEDKEAKR